MNMTQIQWTGKVETRCLKNTWCNLEWWLMPVIPATLEAETGGWWSEMNWSKMIVETTSQQKSWAW
jgi:hypothetical protein